MHKKKIKQTIETKWQNTYIMWLHVFECVWNTNYNWTLIVKNFKNWLDDNLMMLVCVSIRFVRCIPSLIIGSNLTIEWIFLPWHIDEDQLPNRVFHMNRAPVIWYHQPLHTLLVHGTHHVQFLFWRKTEEKNTHTHKMYTLVKKWWKTDKSQFLTYIIKL